MSALDEARSHLCKAREFLEAAELNLDHELFNAATSAAVTSGINAKDAVCLALVGATGKSDGHVAAVAELRQAGGSAAQLATTLGRLLRLKSKSQYQAVGVARTDAIKAVEWATKLVDGATIILQR